MEQPRDTRSFLQRTLAQYEQMVMMNYERLNTFDSLMRAAAYLLPSGRFGDAELQYEAGSVAFALAVCVQLVLTSIYLSRSSGGESRFLLQRPNSCEISYSQPALPRYADSKDSASR